jgi:hypothetical protein
MQTNVLLSSSNGIQPPILHRHRCSTPVRRTLPHICPWWAWSVHNFTVDNSYTNTACRMRPSTPMSANIIEAIQKGVRANIKMQLAAFYENLPPPASPKAGPAPSLRAAFHCVDLCVGGLLSCLIYPGVPGNGAERSERNGDEGTQGLFLAGKCISLLLYYSNF